MQGSSSGSSFHLTSPQLSQCSLCLWNTGYHLSQVCKILFLVLTFTWSSSFESCFSGSLKMKKSCFELLCDVLYVAQYEVHQALENMLVVDSVWDLSTVCLAVSSVNVVIPILKLGIWCVVPGEGVVCHSVGHQLGTSCAPIILAYSHSLTSNQ